MNTEERIDRLKETCEMLYEDCRKRRDRHQAEIDRCQKADKENDSFHILANKLKWELRDIFKVNHELSILNRIDSILHIEGHYETDDERLEALRSYMNDLVTMVMGEDTLNFSTSPESNLDQYAQYMAMRKYYNIFSYKV